MAVKKIVKYGTETLRQKSKDVHKVSKKIQILIDDLLDTMYATNGVGLAAPQIGENIRVFVIDTSTGKEAYRPIVFVNPRIVKRSGAMDSYEGCLSFPEAYTNVRRYSHVMIKALDRNGKPFVLEAEKSKDSLLVRAIQHEYDHLDGILFIDHSRNRFDADKALAEKGLPPVDANYLLDEAELEALILSSEEGENK